MATDPDKSGLLNTDSVLELTSEDLEQVIAGKTTRSLLQTAKDGDVYSKIIPSFYKECD